MRHLRMFRAGAATLLLGWALALAGCSVGPRGAALGWELAEGLPAPATLWGRDAGRGIETTPLLTGGDSLFVATTDRRIQLLRASTGERVWRKRIGGTLTGAPEVSHDNLVAATLLPDAAIYRLDLAERKFVWRRELGEAVGRVRLFESTLLVPTRDGRVHGLAPTDGRTIWVTNLETIVSGDPALVADRALLLVPGRNGQLSGVDARSGEKRWVVDLKEPLLGVAADSGLVVATGIRGGVYALDPVGGRGLWSVETRAPLSAAPVLADGRVFLATLDGQVLAWDRVDGTPLWRRTLGGPFRGGPVVAGETALLTAASGQSWLLRTADGTPLLAWRHGEPVLGEPVSIGDGRWLVAGERGLLALSRVPAEQLP